MADVVFWHPCPECGETLRVRRERFAEEDGAVSVPVEFVQGLRFVCTKDRLEVAGPDFLTTFLEEGP